MSLAMRRSARSRWASLLKRSMSRNMPQNPGDQRLLRWANRLLRLLPLYSRPVSGSLTEKLISVALLATPSWSSRRMKFGYVQSLNTMNPVSTAYWRPSTVTGTVCV